MNVEVVVWYVVFFVVGVFEEVEVENVGFFVLGIYG